MTEEAIQPQRPRSPLRRIGCVIALVIWFTVLLLPCVLITLAVQQEIVIPTGSAPGQQTRLWLISEAEQRGLAISSATVKQSDSNAICVQTDVRYLLWTGNEAPSVYCECYARQDENTSWTSTTSNSGECAG